MEKLRKSISVALDAVTANRWLLALRVISSLAGLAGLFWPNPPAESVIRWAAGVLVALTILSFMIQIVEKWYQHFSDRIAYAIVAEKYGYGYEDLIVKAYLEESTREMRVHRRVHVRATATQNRVRHYLHSLVNLSQGDIKVAGLHKIEPPEIDITAKKVLELSFNDKMVIEVTFNPHLDAGDLAVYELKEIFPPGAFATTAEEVKRQGLSFEYLSWHVNKPIRALEYMVSIPKSLRPKECGYDVWYGGYSRQRHKKEFQRLEPLFDVKEDELPYTAIQLKIPFPVLGLVYVLKWQYEHE